MISPRYKLILRLREKGHTFAAIGEKLSISRQRAWELWKRAFDRTQKKKVAV